MSDPQRAVDRYFDHESGYWLEVYQRRGLEGRIYRERLAAVLRWVAELDLAAGAPALDVGCGAGLAALGLAHIGLAVTATDSSPAMVELARATSARALPAERFQVLGADAHTLPFEADSFDLVIALGLLPWLHDPQSAAVEMARVLRPGAWMVVTADNRWRLNLLVEPRQNPLLAPLKPVRRAFKSDRATDAVSAPSRLDRPPDVDRLLATAGLRPIRRTTIGYGPFTVLSRPLLSDAASTRIHNRLTALSAERVPELRRMGWHYLVAARK